MTIWVDFGGNRIDEQLVIVERIVKGAIFHYTLKSLEKKTDSRLQWGEQEMRNSELFLKASEMASILYE